jgi:regulator of sirC expression with transglutaminase-like and TPR domain
MGAEEAWRELLAIAQSPEKALDLDRSALVLAAAEYPELDIAQEIAALDSLAAGAARRLGDQRDPLSCLNTLSEYIFDELGFRGNNDDYYDPRNSYLNEVLSRRVGIPITLSLVYIETGRRLGVPLLGVGMPGHFMVRHRDVDDLFVDPFNGGILLTEAECAERVRQVTWAEVDWDRRYLAPIGNREFIARMVRNLKGAYMERQDHSRALRMIDWLLAAQPEAVEERRDRGIVSYRLGNYSEALDDLRTYLASPSRVGDAEAVRDLIARIEGRASD